MTDTPATPDVAATRRVGNASDRHIYIDGFGFLAPDAIRATEPHKDKAELVEVPNSDAVEQLLGIGALWTHEQEQPQADAPAPADSGEDASTPARKRTTTRRGSATTED